MKQKNSIFQKYKFFKLLSPFRILVILLLILSIVIFITHDHYKNDPGFGGIAYVLIGSVCIISIIIDGILTSLLSPLKNWKTQSIIISVLITFVLLIVYVF